MNLTSRIYSFLKNMKARYFKPKNKQYIQYFGRGHRSIETQVEIHLKRK